MPMAKSLLMPESQSSLFDPEILKRESDFERELSFYNIHTGESLKKVVFWAKGEFINDSLKDINKLFRDHRSGDVGKIDPKLILLLHEVREKLENKQAFHLISGFRSLKTNTMLCERSSGVAKKSQHCLGKAADIALPGTTSLKNIQKAALSLKRGGVGLYSQFVHIDTGRVRSW